MSLAKAGAQGYAPSVTIEPTVRKPQTVGDLLQVLQGLDPDTPVLLSSGALGKARKTFDVNGAFKHITLYSLTELK